MQITLNADNLSIETLEALAYALASEIAEQCMSGIPEEKALDALDAQCKAIHLEIMQRKAAVA